MKLFARPNSFFEMMTLVIYINYAVGLRVFEYPRGYPRSILSLIYLSIIFFIYCGGAFIMQPFFVKITLLKLDYIIYLTIGNVYIGSVIIKMTMGWWHSKKVTVCYKKIFEIDKTLRQLGLAVNYDRLYFMMIKVIFVWFLATIIIVTVGFLHFRTHTNTLHAIYMTFISIISVTIDYINGFEFYVFSRCLQTKFELINYRLHETIRNLSKRKANLSFFELKDYIKLTDFEEQNISFIEMIPQWSERVYSASNFILRKPSLVTSQIETNITFQLKKKLQNKCRNLFQSNISTQKCENNIHLLQIMKQMHLELCKVSKLICSSFGIQLAWEIGEIIISIIHTLYSLYNRYLIQIIKDTRGEISMAIFLCVISIFKIFILSRACKNAANEGNKTTELIHIPYGGHTDIDTQEEMQQFGIQILQSPVVFYVFGLTMDNHILSMILHTVTTYMVILIQVSISLESNSAIKDLQF